MFKSLTNEEFLQKLNDCDVKDIPLEEYHGAHTKIKWQCHVNESHIYYAEPSKVYKNKRGCPYCTHQKVFVGETDMWTTNPELASMLKNHDDGYKYFANSNNKVDWVCPICKSLIKDKIIANVHRQGLSCENCSDGISFSEKFVHCFLLQLNCDVIHDRTTSWSCGKRYDFYIPSMSLIIETHGIQHYTDSFDGFDSKRRTRTVDEEIANDADKKDLAKSNGIKHYIELDCRYSDFEYIKASIYSSELSELFDLSVVDWDNCLKSTITSNVVICSDLWNSGIKSTKDISDYTGMHVSSVISNLKKAAKIGLCDYKPYYNHASERYKKTLCIETGKIYECLARVEEDGFNYTAVSACCNGRTSTAYGMHWQFV